MSGKASLARHILLVEDEEHLKFGIRYNLEAEGYRVSAVGDGPAALDVLTESEPPVDLVILDLMLPGMSGYTVCQKMREMGYDLPVLILSARTLSEDRKRGFDVGADQYLMKPFDLDELLSRVKLLLMRHAGRTRIKVLAEVVRFGQAVINFETFEVSVADEPVKLTHTEMKLLRYFIEHPDRVISRDELLQNVWGYDASPTTRTVDNFLLRFRRIFEQDPANPRHFLSVRGAGYRFVADPPPES